MPKFLLRMFRRGGYANRFMDRFGFYPPDIMAQLCDNTARIWIHAVSVGEVSVAGQLMDEMRRQRPETAFVLSVTSSTGWSQAHRILRSSDILIHNPLDYRAVSDAPLIPFAHEPTSLPKPNYGPTLSDRRTNVVAPFF